MVDRPRAELDRERDRTALGELVAVQPQRQPRVAAGGRDSGAPASASNAPRSRKTSAASASCAASGSTSASAKSRYSSASRALRRHRVRTEPGRRPAGRTNRAQRRELGVAVEPVARLALPRRRAVREASTPRAARRVRAGRPRRARGSRGRSRGCRRPPRAAPRSVAPAGAQRELFGAVAAERRVRMAVDEPRNRAEPAAVELLDLAVERAEVAHPPDRLDLAAGAEDDRRPRARRRRRALGPAAAPRGQRASRAARGRGPAAVPRRQSARATSAGSSRARARRVLRLRVAGVEVTHDARAGVGREHALEPLGSLVGAVRDDDHPGVDRVADPDAAAVVDAHPGRARGDVDERVQDRPVGDRVRAVAHRLGLAVRRGDRAGIEVVAADHDRRLDRARSRTSSLIASPALARSP